MPNKPKFGFETGYGSGSPEDSTTPTTKFGFESGYGSTPTNSTVGQIPSSITGPIAAGMQQVTSQPDVQPFQGMNPFTRPQGGPTQQVLGSLRQLYSLPLRYAQTIQQASQPVADVTAETLGKAGVNPYVSAGAGMAAGIAANPFSYVTGEAPPGAAPSQLSDAAAATRSLRTGIKAQQFQRLYNDPNALFLPGSTEQAGEAIGTAKEAAGISPGIEHGEPTSLTPKAVQAARAPRSAGRLALNSIMVKLGASEGSVEGAGITPQELSDALADSNNRLGKLQPGTQPFQQESAIKDNLNNILEQIAPDVRSANQQYARYKLRDLMQNTEPLNKGGTPSKLAMFGKLGASAIGAIAGHSMGQGLLGTGVGYEGMNLLNQAYHSPYANALVTVGGSYADKAIDPLIQALQSQMAQRGPAIAAYIKNRLGANQ